MSALKRYNNYEILKFPTHTKTSSDKSIGRVRYPFIVVFVVFARRLPPDKLPGIP